MDNKRVAQELMKLAEALEAASLPKSVYNILDEAEKQTGVHYGLAFSKGGRKVTLNEHVGGGHVKPVSPPMSKREFAKWIESWAKTEGINI